MEVVIVGGSAAGLFAGLLLARAGHQVLVLERDCLQPAPLLFFVRAAILLARNRGPLGGAPRRSQQLSQLAGPRVINIPIPLMGPRSGIGLPGVPVAVLTGTTLLLVAA